MTSHSQPDPWVARGRVLLSISVEAYRILLACYLHLVLSVSQPIGLDSASNGFGNISRMFLCLAGTRWHCVDSTEISPRRGPWCSSHLPRLGLIIFKLIRVAMLIDSYGYDICSRTPTYRLIPPAITNNPGPPSPSPPCCSVLNRVVKLDIL
ncbi:hypothetical protein BD779DRAFT_627007 [Infundibulicybe gibba]|nr:hypothetical protein BD779DRAFT_627007 [Infundibulicybe gibba]